jgi:6-phosphogluconolactonase (cycloisomerase 2 family)
MKRVVASRIRLILLFASCVLAGCKGAGSGNNVSSGTPSPTLQSIRVSPANSSVPLGRTQQFTATGMLSDGSAQDLTSTVTWSSSVPTVGTISNAGLASSKNQGSTIILATSGSVSGSTNWSVVAPALVSIAVSPANDSVPKGTNLQFNAMGTFTDGSVQDLTSSVMWLSSQHSVISVSSAGLASGVTTGKATITAASVGVSGSTSVTVILPFPRFAYVANRNDSSISIYAVDSASGQMRASGYVLTGGVIGGAQAFSVTVDPTGKFAYVTDGSLSVFGFTINASTGVLTAVPGSPFAVGTAPVSVTVDPSGRFVYVASTNSNNVSAFIINPSTGALTPVPGSPFPAGLGPIAATVDPSGRFLYVSDSSSSDGVSAFTISQSSGFLTTIPGSPFATGTGPGPVAVDPTGRFAYIPNFNSNTVAAFTIDASTGALTAVGLPVAAGTEPDWIAIDPTGKFAYVTNNISNDVSAFTIDPSTGALAAVGPPVGAGTNPVWVTVDPSGQFAYVANFSSNNVSAFAINSSTGALTALPQGPVAARSAPDSVAITGGNPLTSAPQFAYVSNNGTNSVSAFTINAGTGALTTVPGSPFDEGGAARNPVSVTADPSGRFVYVANSNSINVSAFTVDSSTGALAPVPGSPFGTSPGTSPESVAVDPSGQFMYVANASNSVSAFAIDISTGALATVPGSPFAENGGASGSFSVTADPSDQFVYVANFNSNNVSGFRINPSTGVLTSVPFSPFSAGNGPLSLTADPTGKFVYVANSASNNVSVLPLIPSSGALAAPGLSFPVGSRPSSVTVDPTGQFVYVANFNSNNVSAFTINPSTGGLVAVLGSPFAVGTNPSSLTIDMSGKFLYVANLAGVSTFTINASTGALAPEGSPVSAGPGSIAVTTTGKIQ